MKINRRQFTRSAAAAGIFTFTNPFVSSEKRIENPEPNHVRLKLSLNAYSFDKPLRAGTMNLDDLLDFCAEEGFHGADLTGYYFPGYPSTPSDEYIFHIRQKAFRLGLDLGCTGVKNDFTWADPSRRAEEKKLVTDWILVAAKLGAPGLRIFAGNLSEESYSWEDRAAWIASDIRECAEFAKKHGVIIALQNHFDFLKTPEEVEKMLKMINHKSVGLMLDIGSYRSEDPYRDIERSIGYAYTWQIKEKVYLVDKQVDTDFTRLLGIIRSGSYSGYLPLETLGEGDPYVKVKALHEKVSKALLS